MQYSNTVSTNIETCRNSDTLQLCAAPRHRQSNKFTKYLLFIQFVIRDCRMCAVLFPGLYFYQTFRFISKVGMFGTQRITVKFGTQRITVKFGTQRITVKFGTQRITVKFGTQRITVNNAIKAKWFLVPCFKSQVKALFVWFRALNRR